MATHVLCCLLLVGEVGEGYISHTIQTASKAMLSCVWFSAGVYSVLVTLKLVCIKHYGLLQPATWYIS
jgi:hypothetical protein